MYRINKPSFQLCEVLLSKSQNLKKADVSFYKKENKEGRR